MVCFLLEKTRSNNLLLLPLCCRTEHHIIPELPKLEEFYSVVVKKQGMNETLFILLALFILHLGMITLSEREYFTGLSGKYSDHATGIRKIMNLFITTQILPTYPKWANRWYDLCIMHPNPDTRSLQRDGSQRCLDDQNKPNLSRHFLLRYFRIICLIWCLDVISLDWLVRVDQIYFPILSLRLWILWKQTIELRHKALWE